MELFYARALLEAIESGVAPKDAIARLSKLLEDRGRLKLLPRIAHAFRRLATKHSRKRTMQLSVARSEDRASALKAAEAYLAESGIGDTDLEESVDETLIGGWRLEGRGLLLDASWKKDLLSIYTAATN